MEFEREQERKTYRLCQLGFGLLAGSLLLACTMDLVSLPVFFMGRRFLPRLFESPLWTWSDTPIVFGSLIGCYLLMGRWRTPSWQQRTGFLVVMGIVDVVLWLAEHAAELGVGTEEVGHVWFRQNLGHALGWAELALIASIASEVLVHLGLAHAAEAGRATRSFAASGATFWMLLFCLRTNWRAGWPLQAHPLFQETLLLMIGTTLIWTVVLIQVTALTMAAARWCAITLKEMDREDRENDPLRSASDQDNPVTPIDRF